MSEWDVIIVGAGYGGFVQARSSPMLGKRCLHWKRTLSSGGARRASCIQAKSWTTGAHSLPGGALGVDLRGLGASLSGVG